MSSDPEVEIGLVEGPLESNIAQGHAGISGGLPERYLLPSDPLGTQAEPIAQHVALGSLAKSSPDSAQAYASLALEHNSTGFYPRRDSPRMTGPQQQALQHRMEDVRSSLEMLSTPSTAEPSPRAARIRRDRQTDAILLNEHELANLTDVDSLPSPQSLTRGASGQLTDRATSPSAASITSMASSTASGFTTGRKNLEWDSGADLGYLGELQPQKEAAGSLCPLEKIAIGNYSAFLQSDPERKHEKAQGVSNARRNLHHYQKFEEERMRQRLIQTFAQRLPKQNLSRLVTDSSPEKGGRKRCKSRDRGSAMPSSIPSANSSALKKNLLHITAPMRAHSLNDLKSLQDELVSPKFRNHRSNSDVSQYAWLESSPLRHYLYGSEEPSSCSSTGTVVPLQGPSLDTRVDLQVINTDVKSLPVQLQGLYHGGGCEANVQYVMPSLSQASTVAARGIASMTQPNESQNSLHSHQSASRSFETVINVSHPPRRCPEKNRWVTQDNLHSDSSDADKEVEPVDMSNMVARHQEVVGSDDVALPIMKISKRHIAVGPSHPSSVPTTSDEDLKQNSYSQNRAKNGSSREPLPSTNTATSTMESTQIDRARSFEYFPGEHFPIQENSSSYEYLPGHLITDRPGTVVSNYPGEQKGSNKSRGTKPLSKADSTSSEAIKNIQEKRPKSSFTGGARRRIDLGEDPVSNEVSNQSRELYDLHLKKKHRFYKKMRKYIAAMATASETPEDNKMKLEILEKLLGLVTKQESLLQEANYTAIGASHSRAHEMLDTDIDEAEASIDTSTTKTMRLQDVATNTVRVLEKSPLTDTSSASSSSKVALDASLKKTDTSASPITRRSKENNIQMHQTRIEQMRILRKEIKKLEKQEYAQLGQALREAGGGLTFLGEGPTDISDASSLLSTSTCPSEGVTKTVTSVDVAPKIATNVFEEAKASASVDGKSYPKMKERFSSNEPAGNQRTFTRNFSASRVIEGQAHQRGRIEHGLKGQPSDILDGERGRRSSLKLKARKADVGQSFPTPRSSAAVIARNTQSASKAVQTEKRPESGHQNADTLNDYSSSPLLMSSAAKPHTPPRVPSKLKCPRKPVAFYLQVDNESPIRVGTRLLREKNPEEGLGKENRNILANYMAALDTNTLTFGREKKHRRRNTSSTAGSSSDDASSSRVTPTTLTLQDALEMKRPDFVARANQRAYMLRRARDQRLQHEERMRAWLEELSMMPSHLRKLAVPNFSPIKIERVFNYKEMVESTRRKYLNLPEVRNRFFESKKKTSYRTNRLMKEIYKTKLQENVLGGRVSLSHYNNVFI